MKSRGFTLIEMLVTVSVFGLALATLLGALRVGGDSKVRVENAISHSYEQRAALARIQSDLLGAALEKDNPTLHFSSGEEEEEVLNFFAFFAGGQLFHVRYLLDEEGEPGGPQRLVRMTAPVALDEPLPPYAETVVLEGIEKLSFSFWEQGEWNDAWDPSDRLPAKVRLRGSLRGENLRTPFEMTVALPAAAYFGGGHGN